LYSQNNNNMARTLTTTEKKELKLWAKENGLNLDYNKKLEFGNGFWVGEEIASLKAALLELEDAAALRSKARLAVGIDYVAYDTVEYLGNKDGFELIGHEGKEVWVKKSSMIYINGFLAISKNLFN
jgi:hypothetical protein